MFLDSSLDKMEKITQKRESGISRIVGVEENMEEEILSLFGEQTISQERL